jgi:hypothetical protein
MKVARGLAVVVFVLFGAAACGGGQETGSEKVLDFKEQQKAERLGAATAKPTVKPASTPASRATAAPAATAQAAKQIVDVQLTAGNPYYAPSDQLRMPAGATLRVTNKDMTPERTNGRSFTDEAGSFDSGLLKPGKSWSQVITKKGTFSIVDQGLNFARATLQVY